MHTLIITFEFASPLVLKFPKCSWTRERVQKWAEDEYTTGETNWAWKLMSER